MSQLIPDEPQPVGDKPWGKANPIRGAKHHDEAIAFVRAFPVGSTLSTESFDRWAHQSGLLNYPEAAPKHSDAWKAHLHRRHELRYRLNNSGAHPRMDTPFTIVSAGLGVLEVCSPDVAIANSDLTRSLESLCITKKRQIAYLMQSADWNALPPHERWFAEALYDDLNMFQRQIQLGSDCLSEKFEKLRSKLQRGLESGDINPRNGGIREMLNPAPDEADET